MAGRREALPLLGKSIGQMQLAEHALEGMTSGLPAPSVGVLADIQKRLTDIVLGALQELAKQESSVQAQNFSRGWGCGRGDHGGRSDQGCGAWFGGRFPAQD